MWRRLPELPALFGMAARRCHPRSAIYQQQRSGFGLITSVRAACPVWSPQQIGGETMTQDELSAEVRLYAIEGLLTNLLATQLLMTGVPQQLLATLRQQMIEGARLRAFPELGDAAMSDAAAAELEAAVDRLMEMGSAQIDQALQARQRKTGGS
jgi:hypothetical protein